MGPSRDTWISADRGRTSSESLEVSKKVSALSDPALYGRSLDVTRIETHFSWIFLVGQEVYKLKKPLKKPYIDLSTLELRRQNCTTEALLNQRLTERVYKGVEALTHDPMGRFHLYGLSTSLPAVDWVVHQRRLDPGVSMQHLMRDGAMTCRLLESLAHRLIKFYRSQPPLHWTENDYEKRLYGELEDCRKAFSNVHNHVPPIASTLVHVLEQFVDRARSDLINSSILGRIVEGHGDLRPEHIFFEDAPQIIDCLEFSYDLRCRDPFDEIAYLALECESLGCEGIGEYLLEAFRGIWKARVPPDLLHFYAASRGLVRAKLAAWRCACVHGADLERWERKLRSYLGLAAKHAGAL